MKLTSLILIAISFIAIMIIMMCGIKSGDTQKLVTSIFWSIFIALACLRGMASEESKN